MLSKSLSFLTFLAIILIACEKENQLPTCEITKPSNGAEHDIGDLILISVEANDEDGNISEVRFYTNEIKVGTTLSSPHKYYWFTDNEEVGTHKIRVSTMDNAGDSISVEIEIILNPRGSKYLFTDPRDSISYLTKKIGNQVWMAENLKYMPSVSPNIKESITEPYYYVFDYRGTSINEVEATTNYETYGVLYNWSAAVDACPPGWHLPSYDEWTELEDFLGGNEVAGGKLKEYGITHWESPNIGGTNVSGFTGLPGGYLRYAGNSFQSLGGGGLWWNSTDNSTTIGMYRGLAREHTRVTISLAPKQTGLSVRCVKN